MLSKTTAVSFITAYNDLQNKINSKKQEDAHAERYGELPEPETGYEQQPDKEFEAYEDTGHDWCRIPVCDPDINKSKFKGFNDWIDFAVTRVEEYQSQKYRNGDGKDLLEKGHCANITVSV
jgi:hypothetical protein